MALEIDDICSQVCEVDVFAALQNLPDTLADTFNRALFRIRNQKKTAIAKKVFKWVSVVKRPLVLDELQEALCIRVGGTHNEPARLMPHIKKIPCWCANLIELDELSNAVQFMHHSVRTFILDTTVNPPLELQHFHDDEKRFEISVGELCITYLNWNDFRTAVVPFQKASLLCPEPRDLTRIALRNEWGQKTVGAISRLVHKSREKPDAMPEVDEIEDYRSNAESRATRSVNATYAFLRYAKEYWMLHNAQIARDSTVYQLWTQMVSGSHQIAKTPWSELEFQNADLSIWTWAESQHHAAVIRALMRRASIPLNDTESKFELGQQHEGPWEEYHRYTSSLRNERKETESRSDIESHFPDDWNAYHSDTAVPEPRSTDCVSSDEMGFQFEFEIQLSGPWDNTTLQGRTKKANNLSSKFRFTSTIVIGFHDNSLLDEYVRFVKRNLQGLGLSSDYSLLACVHVVAMAFWDTIGPWDINIGDQLEEPLSRKRLIKKLGETKKYPELWRLLYFATVYNRLDRSMTNLLVGDLELCSTPRILGTFPLEIAVRASNLEAMQILLDRGADPRQKASTLDDSLHLTVRRGNLQIMKALIHYVDLKQRNDMGHTALHLAVVNQQEKMVWFLLSRGADVNTKDNQGISAIHSSIKCEQTAIFDILERHGADLKVFTGNGKSLLDEAVRLKSEKIVQILLDRGLNPNHQGEDGETALLVAVRLDSKLNVIRLLRHGGLPDIPSETGHTPLHVAMEFKRHSILDTIIRSFDFDYFRNLRIRASLILHLAVLYNMATLAISLIHMGVSLEHENRTGETPYAYAVRLGRHEMERVILAHRLFAY